MHLLTERHEVIFAEGIATEIFWPGPEAVRGLPAEAMQELFELFPELASAVFIAGDEGRKQVRATYGSLARRAIKRRDLKNMLLS
ncbi:hypothetical protein AB838_16680 [Rhodobacteraceae bacterium (ex Bugula neritina AB1)]|nr:hypothetical protein AB838_16680 [Rhodobacteraceae bacterium (ex Bugula neritina AB1)]